MTIDELLRLLLRRWWLLVLLALVGAGVGYALESSRPNVYEATGRVVIGPNLEDESRVIESTGSLDRSTLPQTLAEVATGSEVRRAAGEELEQPIGDGYEVGSVVIPGTSVVEISVSGEDEDSVVDITSAIMDQSESLFEGLYPIYDVVLLDEPGRTDGPISPNPTLGAVIGAIVGVLLAAIIAAATGRRRDGPTDHHHVDHDQGSAPPQEPIAEPSPDTGAVQPSTAPSTPGQETVRVGGDGDSPSQRP